MLSAVLAAQSDVPDFQMGAVAFRECGVGVVRVDCRLSDREFREIQAHLTDEEINWVDAVGAGCRQGLRVPRRHKPRRSNQTQLAALDVDDRVCKWIRNHHLLQIAIRCPLYLAVAALVDSKLNSRKQSQLKQTKSVTFLTFFGTLWICVELVNESFCSVTAFIPQPGGIFRTNLENLFN